MPGLKMNIFLYSQACLICRLSLYVRAFCVCTQNLHKPVSALSIRVHAFFLKFVFALFSSQYLGVAGFQGSVMVAHQGPPWGIWKYPGRCWGYKTCIISQRKAGSRFLSTSLLIWSRAPQGTLNPVDTSEKKHSSFGGGLFNFFQRSANSMG